MKYPKIGYVATTHYDFLLKTWKKHCPQIFRKPQLIKFNEEKFGTEKLDHFDVIIFHDIAGNLRHIRYEIDMNLMSHALRVSQRVSQVWYIGNRTSREGSAGPTHPIWNVSPETISEAGQMSESVYRYRTFRLIRDLESKDDKRLFFETINWLPLTYHIGLSESGQFG